MDAERGVATAGIGAAALVILLGIVPYFLGTPPTVSAYYRATPAGPPVVVLFGILEGIVLLAGLRRRSDPATVAGIAVVLGAFATLIAWWWAAAVDPALAGGVSQADAFRQHRWAFAAAASLLGLAAIGYGKAVLG